MVSDGVRRVSVRIQGIVGWCQEGSYDVMKVSDGVGKVSDCVTLVFHHY